MIKLYCGGTFPFFYLDEDYKSNIKKDYRVNLLGDEKLLLKKQGAVMLSDEILYLGPFYFESDGMIDEEIVAAEKEMVSNCTHAVFLLNEATCPGTIAELIYAVSLGKAIAIFYIQSKEGEEIESRLHTPCWFPIIMSRQMNTNVKLFPCTEYNEASRKVKEYVNVLQAEQEM